MDWGQVLTIIFGVAGFMSIFVFLINRQIDMVGKRLDTIERRIESVERRMERIEQRLDRLEDLLLKVLGAERKN